MNRQLRKRYKRWLKPGDLLVVTTWATCTDFRVGTPGVNRPGGMLNRDDVVVNVGPCERWYNEQWAYVLSRLGLGWVRRDCLEWLAYESEPSTF